MKIGAYDVVREVGRGAMGVVLEARALDGRRVALKVIRTNGAAASERFEREARLLRALSSEEGFVPLLDVGHDASVGWVVMPFLGGGTLRARFSSGPLAADAVVALGVVLGRALGRAHARGIVHRDLKPENVLFSDEGRPLVADLGLAKHFDASSPGVSQSVALSRTGELKGTAGYAAPEQLADARSAGPAADVFALGAILYEALAGVPAFPGDSVHETFRKVLAGEHDSLDAVKPDAPRWLVSIIERALARDPARRYASGTELAAALEARTEERRRSRAPLVATLALSVAALGSLGLLRRVATSGRPDGDAPPVPSIAVATSGGAFARVPSSATSGRPDVASGPPAATRLYALASSDETSRAAISAVAFLPSGRAVVSSGDGSLRVRDLATESTTCEVARGSPVRTIAVLPRGQRVLVGRDDATTELRAASDLHLAATLTKQRKAILASAVTTGGRLAITTSADRTLAIWVVPEETCARVLTGHGGEVTAVAFEADETRAYSAGLDGNVKIWSVFGLATQETVARRTPLRALVAPLRTEWLLVGGDDGVLAVLDRADGHELRKVAAHEKGLERIAATPDAKVVATSGRDGRVVLWDANRATERDRIDLAPLGDRATALALTDDGDELLVGTAKGRLLHYRRKP